MDLSSFKSRSLENWWFTDQSHPTDVFCWVHTVLIFFLISCQYLKIRRYFLNFVISGFPWKNQRLGNTGPAFPRGSHLASAECQIRYTSPLCQHPKHLPFFLCSTCITYVTLLFQHIMTFLIVKTKIICSLYPCFYPKQGTEMTMWLKTFTKLGTPGWLSQLTVTLNSQLTETLDFNSGHDPKVVRSSPTSGSRLGM